jgi:putative aminopeptidase FrvX
VSTERDGNGFRKTGWGLFGAYDTVNTIVTKINKKLICRMTSVGGWWDYGHHNRIKAIESTFSKSNYPVLITVSQPPH